MNIVNSSIFIVNDVKKFSNELINDLPLHSSRLIYDEDSNYENFLIKNAKSVLKEAYIAVSNTKYIILCANRFSIDAQNALLKVLEEPPKNIIFVIVTNSKTTILPTIFSRLSYKYLKVKEKIKECALDLKNLDLKTIYDFIKQNQRISKLELKELIQSILYTSHVQKMKLKKEQLDCFTRSIKLCDLNSRPNTILTTLLLSLKEK